MTQQTNQPDLSVLDEMPHITQSTEDARKAIQKRIELKREEKQEQEILEDPKLREKYIFDFEFTDGRGKRWAGKFRNRIINMTDRQAIGALQAQWQLGLAHAAYDPEIASMNYIIAHMAISLEPLSGADWAKDLRTLRDIELIQALYQEVAAHEATFHGRQAPETPGEAGGRG